MQVMTHSWVSSDPFVSVTWPIYVRAVRHIQAFTFSSRKNHVKKNLWISRNSFIMNVTWLIHASDNSCKSVMWLIYVCAVRHIQAYIFFPKKIIQKKCYKYHVTQSLWMSRDSFMRVMTQSWVSWDSFMCVQYDIFRRIIFANKIKRKNSMNVTGLIQNECDVTHPCEWELIHECHVTHLCVCCVMYSGILFSPKKIIKKISTKILTQITRVTGNLCVSFDWLVCVCSAAWLILTISFVQKKS